MLHKNADATRRPLDEAARRAAPGGFIRLTHGLTHVESSGNPDARTVVLVHGFSVPSWIWDPTFEALPKAGFRTVRYDLYGRGFSDRPSVPYDLSLFTVQLRELLDCLSIHRANLVGLSMGGPIVAAFASQFSDRVESVVLIDPSGGRAIRLGALRVAARFPRLTEALLRLAGDGYSLRSIARTFFEPRLVRAFQEKYSEQMQFDGFVAAILSSIQNGMLGDFRPTYSLLDRTQIPIMIFWGEDDRTLPLEQSDLLRGILPGAQFAKVPKAGHVPHVENPGFVHPLLISFLKHDDA